MLRLMRLRRGLGRGLKLLGGRRGIVRRGGAGNGGRGERIGEKGGR